MGEVKKSFNEIYQNQKHIKEYASDSKKRGTLNENDSYDNTLNKHKKENTPQTEKKIKWSVENIDKIIDQIRPNKADFLDILKAGNLAVVSNHATWANLVILAYVFHKALDISYEDLFIIVGPAITIDLQHLGSAQGVANIMKTLPEKIAKDSPGLATAMFNLFVRSLNTEVLNKVGKIVFISPSGTTDLYKDGKILMKNPEEEKSIVKLIGRVSGKGHCKVVYVGMNDLAIFSDKELRQGKVYMKSTKPMSPPKIMKDVRKNLKPLIIDGAGNQIGDFYNLLSDGKIEIIAA